MQKFKTMSKLKLKTVQNGTEVENPNLMESGSYDYVDCSGYVIIGSGVYDNSGNLVEEGHLLIEAGHMDLEIGDTSTIRLNVSWDSGLVPLPMVFSTGSPGGQPCVPVSFEYDSVIFGIGNCNSVYNDEVNMIIDWRTQIRADLYVSYVLTDGRIFFDEHGWSRFSIPFTYIPPENNDD